jgi:hypothetical protein
MEKVFSKEIFLNSLEKSSETSRYIGFFRLCPEQLLSRIFYMTGRFHKNEVSRIFYAPRFFEENPNYRFLIHGSPQRFLRRKGKNSYLYPYLVDLNLRFEKLVETIKFDNLKVVDLNAGHGNLIKYLPRNATYLGNDIYPQSSHVIEMQDFVFAETLVEVDCLCIFGWATGSVEVESKTQNSAVNLIVDKFKPRYFVAESIIEYEELFLGAFERILRNYRILDRFEYSAEGRHPLRVMYVWEKLTD